MRLKAVKVENEYQLYDKCEKTPNQDQPPRPGLELAGFKQQKYPAKPGTLNEGPQKNVFCKFLYWCYEFTIFNTEACKHRD